MHSSYPAGAEPLDVATRAAQLAAELDAQRDDPAALSLRLSEVVGTLRAVSNAFAALELNRMMLEAKDEQLERQAEMLETIGYPVLLVRAGVLCTPVIGPIDFERARRLMDVALSAAAARATRYFVIDLTGAIVADPNVATCLSDVARALSLIGVRVALSGIRADVAKLLVENQDATLHVATYPTLSAALEAIPQRRK